MVDEDLYCVQIASLPPYKVCWRKHQPEHLQKFIAAAKSNKSILIGEYTRHYQSFFKNADSECWMLDVGANIGLSSFPVAARGYKVVCFEPVAENLEILNHGVTINQFEHLIRIEPFAASDSVDNACIYVPDARADNASMNEVASTKNLNLTSKKVSQIIEKSTLDTWWETYGQINFNIEKLRLLKIDTQGHEIFVLNGAKNILASEAISPEFQIELEWDTELLKVSEINPLDLLNTIDSLSFSIVKPDRIRREDFVKFASAENKLDLILKKAR